VLYVVVAYRAGRGIAGFTPDEILVFVGTFVIATGFYAGVYMMNFCQLSSLIRDGSFDALLTKPVSLQVMATLRRSDIGIFLVDVVAGVTMTAIGLSRLGGVAGAGRLLGYAFFLAGGVAVGYAIYLVPQCLVFRVDSTRAIAGALGSFWDFNNVPMVVYHRVGQAIGSFLVPLFVITSFPALFALGRMEGWQLAWGAVAPVVFLALARVAWSRGIRRYTGASS